MTCQRATRDRGFGLIPVLLPGLPEPFEPSAVLPPFLSTRTWVDLRQGIGNSARLEPLVRAIKGIALPGMPVVYYGDEVGMGDNIYLGDRDGVRTPMQ